MVDIFDPYVLNRVVDDSQDRTRFLTDMFFPSVQTSEEETILFDSTTDRKLAAPFVSPLAEGRLVAELGYETESFRPAYIKDKRVFDPNKQFRRRPGERIGGSLTPAQRLQASVAANLAEQIDMLANRMELMAGDVLQDGIATISGERYPTRAVDFRRRAENTVIKTGAARWGEAGVNPWAEVEAEAQELSDATGYAPTDVIFTPEAWALFRPSVPKDAIDTNLRDIAPSEVGIGYILQPRDGVAYRGRSGYLRFWTYTGSFRDPETGQNVRVLPAHSVLIGSPTLDGVRHFGAIRDLKAGIQARQYFVKSWEVEDPSQRFLLMQSAPLLVPYRVNNVKYLRVR